ncbi:MAG: hypothetical protein KGL12_05415 [Rhodospirillales bacterium]|nr:hypothetical protein [Rhodospirillales bacterium]
MKIGWPGRGVAGRADAPPGPVPASQARLARSLADSSDRKIGAIVGLIDAMADRGAADALIAPLRARMAPLRLSRPLRFSRLVFLPLDPLIVAGPDWRPGMARLPRHAILPLSQAVHRGLGEDAAVIEARIAGRSSLDHAMIGDLAPQLWPRAGEILRAIAAAADGGSEATGGRNGADPAIAATWAAAGLPADMLGPLAAGVAAILAEAPLLAVLERDAAHGIAMQDDAVQALLGRAAAWRASPYAGPAWRFLMAALLARLPLADALLRLGTGTAEQPVPPALYAAIAAALEEALAALERGADGPEEIAGADLAEAGNAARRIAALLDTLAAAGPGTARGQRAEALRQRLDGCCRARFAVALDHDVLPRLASPPGAQDVAACASLEQALRDLRRLEGIGRRFGGAALYDTLLREAAALAASGTAPEGLADRVRRVELLAGPEEAMAVLDAAPAMVAPMRVGQV